MTREVLKKWQKKSKSKIPFKEYINLPKEKLGIADYFTPEETKVIEDTIDSFPKLTLDVKCYVKGSDKIYQGDLMTVEVNATRKHGSEKVNMELPNAMHSNRYNHPKQEILWLVVVSKEQKRIFEFAKLHRPFTNVHKEYNVFLEAVS